MRSASHTDQPFILISLVIALIFFCRVFGFMAVVPLLMPSLGLYQGATLFSMGIAIGVYGLMQFFCQLFFGALSDIYGRKMIIAFGLVMLAVGSFICSQASSIQWLIAGRCIQGAGAIGSTCIALLADYIAPKQRSLAMMIVGLGIGASFSLSIVMGPLLNYYYGLRGLFFVVGLLPLFAIFLLYQILPEEPVTDQSNHFLWVVLRRCFFDRYLRTMNLVALLIHLLFTGLFSILPYLLLKQYGYHLNQHFYMYNIFMLFSFVISFLCIGLIRRYADSMQPLLFFSMMICCGLGVAFYMHQSFIAFMLGFSLFLIGFNLLESLLPSLVTVIANRSERGAATGLYSSHQYLGIFLGGILSGYLLHHYTVMITLGVYVLAACLLIPIVLLLYRFHHMRGTVLT